MKNNYIFENNSEYNLCWKKHFDLLFSEIVKYQKRIYEAVFYIKNNTILTNDNNKESVEELLEILVGEDNESN